MGLTSLKLFKCLGHINDEDERCSDLSDQIGFWSGISATPPSTMCSSPAKSYGDNRCCPGSMTDIYMKLSHATFAKCQNILISLGK